MAAGEYSFNVECGTDFSLALVYQNSSGVAIDVSSGYTAKMDIRSAVGGSSVATLANGSGITLGSNGAITIALTDTQTTAIAAGIYVYDLEVTTGSTTSRLIEGNVTFKGQVTTS